MSKKLMMNNYSKNGLTPVMDGLICWLDARDGSGTDTIWKDRSGNGADVTLYDFQYNEVSGWNNGRLVFSGVKNQCMSSPINGFNYENLTYEINVEDIDWEHNVMGDANTCGYLLCFANSNSYNWNGIRFTNDKQNVGVYVSNFNHSYSYFSTITNYQQDLITNKRVLTVVANKNGQSYFYDNNTKYQLSNQTDKDYGINQFVLGCARLNRYPYGKFKVNSVKIYNRALTEEEIQQNYLYEQSIERGE